MQDRGDPASLTCSLPSRHSDFKTCTQGKRGYPHRRSRRIRFLKNGGVKRIHSIELLDVSQINLNCHDGGEVQSCILEDRSHILKAAPHLGSKIFWWL